MAILTDLEREIVIEAIDMLITDEEADAGNVLNRVVNLRSERMGVVTNIVNKECMHGNYWGTAPELHSKEGRIESLRALLER